jgi:hypothetical protein
MGGNGRETGEEVDGGGLRGTYAWTWRKGSCSLVEDIILRQWAG